MDWGIIVWRSSEMAGDSHCGVLALRRELLLGSTWIYVAIASINLVLRFAWTLTLLPFSKFNSGLISVLIEHLGPIVACLEVFRRMLWGILRLEFEQLEVFGGTKVGMSLSSNKFSKVSVAQHVSFSSCSS